MESIKAFIKRHEDGISIGVSVTMIIGSGLVIGYIIGRQDERLDLQRELIQGMAKQLKKIEA